MAWTPPSTESPKPFVRGVSRATASSAKVESCLNHLSTETPAMNSTTVTTYAIDTAKNVTQLDWVEPDSGQIHTKKLPRAKLTEFFGLNSNSEGHAVPRLRDLGNRLRPMICFMTSLAPPPRRVMRASA